LHAVQHPHKSKIVSLHEALYTIDRWHHFNEKIDSQWTRFVTACLFASNCSEDELRVLTEDNEAMLRGRADFLCDR
jgi:hypothetical protein